MDDNDTKKSDVDQTLVKKWNKLSENSRNLIVQMLEKEPFARPSIDEIFDHAWFSEDFTEETQCNLYNEMSYRKTFIADFLRKKPKAS
jgi:serine/threonine protein kinase